MISLLLFLIPLLVGGYVGYATYAADPLAQILQIGVLGPPLLGAVVGGYLSASVQIVSQWERGLLLRLGKYVRPLDPGLHFVNPILCQILRVETRVQTLTVEAQQAITQDNVPVEIDSVVFCKVVTPNVAMLEVENYTSAIRQMAMAILRDVIGRLSLDEVLSHQARIEQETAEAVEAKASALGLHVQGIKIKDVSVPEEMEKAMSRQASSEREKRATIIKAEGDKLAADALSAAARTMAESPGAMQLRTLQSLDGLGPGASNTVVLALPIELTDALRSVGMRTLPTK